MSFGAFGDGSGRIENLDYAIANLGILDLPEQAGIVMVERIRQTCPKIETGTRVCITSAAAPADKLAAVIRQHWAIENSLHLGIDMVFRDDGCRISSGCAPSNFTTE